MAAGVVRMVGKVDGQEVIFYKEEDGPGGSSRWATVIPKDLDGQYIVEITAYDAAGNEAYSATMLFTIDLKTLRIILLPLNYSTKVLPGNFKALEQEDNLTQQKPPDPPDFAYIVVDSGFSYEELPLNYWAGVIA